MDEHKRYFLAEAVELLIELEEDILKLQAQPADLELVDRLLRSLHTLKRSAAMFGFIEIAEFTYQVEGVYRQIRQGQMAVTSELVELSLAALDQIRLMVESEQKGSWSDPGEEERILYALGRLRFTPDFTAEANGAGDHSSALHSFR